MDRLAPEGSLPERPISAAGNVSRRNFLAATGKLSGVLASGMLLDASGEGFPSMRLPSSTTDLVLMDAVELSQTIHARRASCREVMTAYLDHIARLNPKVNAIVSLQEPDALLKQADERDAQLARGESLGWMHGFPHAVKDLAPT